MFPLHGDPLFPQSASFLLQGDPTGLSSWPGRLVIAAILLSVIILAVRWFWDQRNRR